MNKIQWNSNRNTKIFIHEMHFKMSSAKWRPFCPGEHELMESRWILKTLSTRPIVQAKTKINQSFALPVRGNHRWSVDSPHKCGFLTHRAIVPMYTTSPCVRFLRMLQWMWLFDHLRWELSWSLWVLMDTILTPPTPQNNPPLTASGG